MAAHFRRSLNHMKPTNNLRWIEKRLEADISGYGVSKPIPYTKLVLQQFFSCGKLGEKLTPSGDFINQNIVTHAGLVGEWRDIPTVKS